MDDALKARFPDSEILGTRGKLHLSREERDYIAGHALDSVYERAKNLTAFGDSDWEDPYVGTASNAARQIAALSNLLGDIGWEREAPTGEWGTDPGHSEDRIWILGELFPAAQLRPWLEEWQRQDDEALVESEALSAVADRAVDPGVAERQRTITNNAQIKLGTGAILLARIEKWMACKEN